MTRGEEDRLRLLEECRRHNEFLTLECGTFVFDPRLGCGAMASHHLRWIADELDRLNKPLWEMWERELGNRS